jgi:hypothetical protein
MTQHHAPVPPAGYPPSATPRGTTAAAVGIALGGIAILVLGFWLGTRERTPAIPQLTLIEPRPGAVVERPVELIFDVHRSRMRVGPGGWGVGAIHIHAWVDGVEIMPAAADIEYIGAPARYRWRLPRVEPGERSIRIGWSDIQHRELGDGGSGTVEVIVR